MIHTPTPFWRNIARLLRPYRGWVALCAFANMVNVAATAASGLLFKPLIDAVLSGRFEEAWRWITLYVIAIAPVCALYWLGRWAQTRFVTGAAHDCRVALARHVQRLPIARIDRENTGELMARINTGADRLADLLDRTPELYSWPLTFIVGMAAMLYLSWPLTLLALAFAVPATLVAQHVMKPVEALSHKRVERASEATAMVQDALAGVAVVKAFGLKAAMLARLNTIYESVHALSDAAEKQNIKALVPYLLAQYVPQIVVPLAAGAFAVAGWLSSGGALAVSAVYYMIVGPVSGVGYWRMQLSFLRPEIQRAFEVLDMATEPPGRALTDCAPVSDVPLTISALQFRYADDREPVLRDVSLQVPAGRTVALVGASGGGKSSVIKLICGFYAPQSGEICIFGQSLAELDPDSARRMLALVSQDTYLFPGTIAENIGQGRPAAGFDEIVAAARAAHADAFIREQPEGYQTRVGERGVLLSGGQRQRIALARAILKDAPILLLDEPTASLDLESERLIQDALARFGRGRATLVVAHRLSTIRDADEIVVLDNGGVAERGAHAQLMAADGVYRRLVAQQMAVAS